MVYRSPVNFLSLSSQISLMNFSSASEIKFLERSATIRALTATESPAPLSFLSASLLLKSLIQSLMMVRAPYLSKGVSLWRTLRRPRMA